MEEKKKKTKKSKKLWGKVSSFVSNKMKRASFASIKIKDSNDHKIKTKTTMMMKQGDSNNNSNNNNVRKLQPIIRSVDIDDISSNNEKNKMTTTMKESISSTNISLIVKNSTTTSFSSTSTHPNNYISPSTTQNIRPVSPSSYLLKSTLNDHIHELANEYNVDISNNNNKNNNLKQINNTSSNITDKLHDELQVIALKKLEIQKQALLNWENVTHHNTTTTTSNFSSRDNNMETIPLTSDPINLLISTLNKTESKLDEIETRLIPQSNDLKRTIQPLKPIYSDLEELLLHFKNKQMLIERLEYIMNKIEMKQDIINVLENMEKYLSINTESLSTFNNNKSNGNDDDDTNGNVQMENDDVNDMLISAVSETLKKLEEIRKDLSMFKDIKAIKETKSKLKKYLLKLNHLLVSNLLSQRELDVINAYAKNNNTNKQEVYNDEGEKKNLYLKINDERPNLVLLYKMLFPIRKGE